MGGRLEIRKFISLRQPVFATALSDDGQFIVGGMESHLAVFDVTGQELLRHPRANSAVPMHRVALAGGMNALYAATRDGRLARLELTREADAFRAQAVSVLYTAENDLHSLALCGDRLAVGHLGPGLALLSARGQVVWRLHPSEGNATEGQVWSVAFDPSGETLYVGSAGLGENALAALDPEACAIKAHTYVAGLVSQLAALPDGRGVAAALMEPRADTRLALYGPDLTAPRWQCSFERPITAMAADPKAPVLVIACGFEGDVVVIDLRRNEIVGDARLKTTVNALAISQGRALVAGTSDGDLVLMRYLPEGFRL
jgi:hypothetical protein